MFIVCYAWLKEKKYSIILYYNVCCAAAETLPVDATGRERGGGKGWRFM
jgi:hypothetical protein